MDAETIAGIIFVLIVVWCMKDTFSFSSHNKGGGAG